MAIRTSNVGGLLARLGRSSTPEVKQSPFGITLGSITKINEDIAGNILIVSNQETIKSVRNPEVYTFGVPGMLVEQAKDTSFEYLIIDANAFNDGPWMGSDNGGNKHLADEIFNAGSTMRARGAMVFYIPRARGQNYMNGPEILRLISTSTVDLSRVPEVDLEEQAPQSELWEEWIEIARKREINGHA